LLPAKAGGGAFGHGLAQRTVHRFPVAWGSPQTLCWWIIC